MAIVIKNRVRIGSIIVLHWFDGSTISEVWCIPYSKVWEANFRIPAIATSNLVYEFAPIMNKIGLLIVFLACPAKLPHDTRASIIGA